MEVQRLFLMIHCWQKGWYQRISGSCGLIRSANEYGGTAKKGRSHVSSGERMCRGEQRIGARSFFGRRPPQDNSPRSCSRLHGCPPLPYSGWRCRDPRSHRSCLQRSHDLHWLNPGRPSVRHLGASTHSGHPISGFPTKGATCLDGFTEPSCAGRLCLFRPTGSSQSNSACNAHSRPWASRIHRITFALARF